MPGLDEGQSALCTGPLEARQTVGRYVRPPRGVHGRIAWVSQG